MSLPDHPATGAVVIRTGEVETLADDRVGLHLLADSGTTAGALSTLRVTLAPGADGAAPHRHQRSSELFYVLSGTAQLLAGAEVITAGTGDLVVVPPGLAHAFAAPNGAAAELLVIITPGVERFEYFRHLARVATGRQPRESLLEVQDRYDTWFLDSPVWQRVRRRRGRST